MAIAVVAVCVALAFLGLRASSAAAFSPQHADAVGQWAYRNAPFPQSTCAATCAELLERQYNLPSYSRTGAELAQLQKRAGLWQRAAPVLGRVSLGATAAVIGWKIGTGIRSLWVNTETPTTTQAPEFDGANFFAKGQTVASFWGVNVLAPADGWALEANGFSYFDTLKALSPCPRAVPYPAVPAEGLLLTADLPQPAGQNCYVQPSGPWVWNTPEQKGVMFVPVKTSVPVEYTSQPYSHTVLGGTDPGLAGAKDAVTTEIDTNPELYPNLRPWLESTLDDIDFERAEAEYHTNDGVDDVVDPDREEYPWTAPPRTDWRRWCELSAPGAGWSTIDTGPDPFDSYHSPPAFAANVIGTADLLYGTDSEEEYGKWHDIKGFGIRKIVAKHGWTSADKLATEAALQTTPVRGPFGSGDRYVFHGDPYDPPDPDRLLPGYMGQGQCVRVVVVATSATDDEPRSRGIVTSFGRWTGPTPPG